MEAQLDIQAYLEQGKQALAQGQGREAAIAYAHAAQIEPENPMVHLGLAEANLALNSTRVVIMASKRVLELQPDGGPESSLAQSLLDLLERRYERAMQHVDEAISKDPGNAYAHALRSYLFRLQGQTYDAGLSRSRAARLSFGGRFENCFPPIEEQARVASGTSYETPSLPNMPDQTNPTPNRAREQEQVPSWNTNNNTVMRRQMIRTRFALSRYPNLITMSLIVINVVVFLISVLLSGGNFLSISSDVAIAMGGQYNALVLQGQVWRIFTAMFLHEGILHIGLNMLTLYFIGTAVEITYGKLRYLGIYLISGIVGGIVTLFLMGPNVLAVGASGAIFGVFGALGVFYIVNRSALGAYGRGAIGNWLFWLGLNLFFGFSTPGIGIWDHIGGLIAGMIIAFILAPRHRRKAY
ncbi:MAG TPA: rhomboid family intramembrane serine protease [Ktedonobacteraceae bacterium]|nr:rhomboid family intramembrane serine protease [Ktedonobacteraceae bacterium]